MDKVDRSRNHKSCNFGIISTSSMKRFLACCSFCQNYPSISKDKFVGAVFNESSGIFTPITAKSFFHIPLLAIAVIFAFAIANLVAKYTAKNL